MKLAMLRKLLFLQRKNLSSSGKHPLIRGLCSPPLSSQNGCSEKGLLHEEISQMPA